MQHRRVGAQLYNHGPLVSALDRPESLQQPERDERDLRQGELLPYADPRPGVEGQVLEPHFQILPALGAELVRVAAVDVLAPVHAPLVRGESQSVCETSLSSYEEKMGRSLIVGVTFA